MIKHISAVVMGIVLLGGTFALRAAANETSNALAIKHVLLLSVPRPSRTSFPVCWLW